MKKIFSIIFAMMTVLCACNDDHLMDEVITSGNGDMDAPVVFTATMEGAPETRATFDGTYKCASWEEGDQISVNGATFTAESAGTSTTFIKTSSGAMSDPTSETSEMRPAYVSTTTPGHYGSLDASKLVDDSGTTNEWCTPTSAKVDGVWNIVVTTGFPAKLKTIKLWNARNTETNYGRTWKKVKVYGSNSANESWGEPIGDFDNLDLAINNYGFAGDLEINATEAYSYYKIDVLENKGGTGDDYMQMADMKFVVESNARYKAYFPASLYNGGTPALPAVQTYAAGKFDMPMYAESTTNDLVFKNLCAVLAVKVTSDDIATLKSIKVKSDKAMYGDFTVTNNKAVLVNATDNNKAVELSCSSALTLDDAGTTFYIAIPAQEYRYLNIYLSSDGTNYTQAMATKKNAGLGILDRSKIVNIDYTSNAFQLWQGGPLWATMNYGADTETGDGSYINRLNSTNWSLPSKEELENLKNNTNSSLVTTYKDVNVTGRVFKGKVNPYTDKEIFLPAAGYKHDGNLSSKNHVGIYMSNDTYRQSPYIMVYCLYFSDGGSFNISDQYLIQEQLHIDIENSFTARLVLR